MKKTHTTLAALLLTAGFASAASISLNFSENDSNQGWSTPSTAIGPLGVQSDNFNTSNNPPGGDNPNLPIRTGDLGAGSLAGLVDDSGAGTAVNVTWASSTVWFNGSGVGDNAQRLAVGYLDDGDTGGQGAAVDFTNLPYALYDVYILLGSDQTGDVYTSQDFTVNGNAVIGGDFTGFSNWGGTSANGTWTEATSTTTGNYIVARNQSGSALNITGAIRDGTRRGSIVGIQILEVPEPATALFGGLAGLALLLRRRR